MRGILILLCLYNCLLINQDLCRMHVNILEECLHVWGNSLLDLIYGDYTEPRDLQ